ncbi:DUF4232 domain-containing protein [Ferrimicrobium sp.]|uniref:DUF4232 domain-containing protein n=1 Tax=Ferrimicrobium sp. TaxID=2926050 RepID=UPI00260513DD|nr:DUF4232 domain-containing protein [Ferrimicrobium sp.]
MAAFVLASCGSSPAASPSSKSTATATSKSGSNSKSTTTATSKSGSKSKSKSTTTTTSTKQPCKASQLSFSITDNGVATGSYDAVGVFKNQGHHLCTLEGYPKVKMIAATGQAIYTTSQQTLFGAPEPSKPVVLNPGASASFAITMSDGSDAGSGGAGPISVPCPIAHSVAVTLPESSSGTSDLVATVPPGDGSMAAFPDSALQACGSISVNPLVPGVSGFGPTSSTTTSPTKSQQQGTFSPVSFTAISANQFWVLGTINGCTTGPCLSILHTTDGGAHFTKIPYPHVQSPGFNPSLRFVTAQDGYALINYSLWFTTNGGASWQKSRAGGVWGQSFATSDGYAYALLGSVGSGHVMRSPIGTDSWTTLPLPTIQTSQVNVNAASTITARGPSLWITTFGGQLVYSNDFGNHFTQVTNPCGAGSQGGNHNPSGHPREELLKASSQSVTWLDCAGAMSSKVYRSTDAGRHWSVVSHAQGTFNIPAIVAPVSTTTAYLARGNTQIVRTTNSGASFSPVASGVAPQGSYWAWIGFTTPQVGSALMGTQQGVYQLWRTTDGGNIWKGPIKVTG